VDEDGSYYPDFPVPRFKCHGKGGGGNPIVQFHHQTFSLLHYHLAPYCKYSISFIIKVLKAKHIKSLSLTLLQDYIADFPGTGGGCDGYIEMSTSRIYSFCNLLEVTVTKLLISGYYQQLTNQLQKCRGSGSGSESEGEKEAIKISLQFITEFECRKVSVPIRGPCALSYDFYLEGGSYFRNSLFLFGTPSQFRIR
jgi:hypothetical protein